MSLIRDALYSDFRLWLQEITGFSDLTDQVDMSCAKYKHTGTCNSSANNNFMVCKNNISIQNLLFSTK